MMPFRISARLVFCFTNTYPGYARVKSAPGLYTLPFRTRREMHCEFWLCQNSHPHPRTVLPSVRWAVRAQLELHANLWLCQRLALYPRDVLAGSGVHADRITNLDEERYLQFQAGFYLDLL